MDLCSAITERRLISFSYDGHPRIVIPAAHGTHVTTGNAVLRGYQVRGSSKSRQPPLWNLFLVEKIVGFEALDETFENDPPGYRRGDQDIQICHEL